MLTIHKEKDKAEKIVCTRSEEKQKGSKNEKLI